MRRLLAILLFVGLAGCTADQRSTEQDALASARFAAAKLGQLVISAYELLEGLTQVPAMTGSDKAVCNELAARIVEQYDVYASLSRIDTDGVLDCSATPQTDKVTVNDRLYYKRVLETKDFSVGEYQIGRLTKKKSIVFAQPVLENEHIASTLILSVDLDAVNDALHAIFVPRRGTSTLLDAGGRVLATTAVGDPSWLGKKRKGFLTITDLGPDAREGSVGRLEDLDGKKRRFGFSVVDGLPKGQNLYVLVGL